VAINTKINLTANLDQNPFAKFQTALESTTIFLLVLTGGRPSHFS